MTVPPLSSIPMSLATPLERQFAIALGFAGHRQIPRLAADVEKENALCNGAGWCLARWFARAALEQVYGGSLAHLPGIPEMIETVRDEMSNLRREHSSFASQREKASKDAELLVSLQASRDAADRELIELRAVRGEISRTVTENSELKVEMGRLAAANRVLEREVEELQASTRDLLESELAQARDSLEETKKDLERQLAAKTASEDSLSRQVKEARKNLEQSRILNQRLQKQIAESPKRGNRSRGRKGARKQSGRPRSSKAAEPSSQLAAAMQPGLSVATMCKTESRQEPA